MKEKDKEIIIYNINSSPSRYSWRELNCFYRMFATALGAINPTFCEAFIILISLYITTVINDTKKLSYNSNDNVLRYYNLELKDIFGPEIICNKYTSYKDFKKQIYSNIKNNHVVIMPYDVFYLPYSKTYLEQHRRHYLIVKGINISKNIVYIIDNMHNDFGSSTEYTDFIIEMDILYKMNRSFCRCFDDVSINNYFWIISLDNKNKNFKEDFKIYLSGICNKIKYRKENEEFELQLYSGKQYIDSREYLEYVNEKILLCSAIRNFIFDNYNKSNIELNNKIADYIDKREDLKVPFIFALKNTTMKVGLKDKIIELQKKEIEILDAFQNIINKEEKIDVKANEKANIINIGNEEYTISNNKNAKIDFNGRQISITLDENVVYDIWKNCNDGVMVYKNVKDGKGQLKAYIRPECKLYSSSNFGVVVVLNNGCKLLFGSLGRFNIAVHKIDDKNDYELFISNYIIKEDILLEIKYEEYKLFFYADEKLFFSKSIDEKIECFGIYAKTWENCFCKVRYSIGITSEIE